MKITHEGVQSIGVVVSLVLSTTSLALQCTPKPENLVVDPGEVVWSSEPFEPRKTAPLPLGNHTLIGPIYWRITFNNRSDRPVSLKRVEAQIRDNKWGRYSVSGAFDGALLEDKTSSALPFTVPPYESKSLVIRGYLPGWISRRARLECLKSRISFADFQRCSFRTGTDLFGNKLEIYESDGNFIGAAWPVNSYRPELVVSFISGENRTFQTTASLIPMPM